MKAQSRWGVMDNVLSPKSQLIPWLGKVFTATVQSSKCILFIIYPSVIVLFFRAFNFFLFFSPLNFKNILLIAGITEAQMHFQGDVKVL